LNEDVAIVLQAKDEASATIARVKGELTGLNNQTARASSGMFSASKVTSGFGNALTHLRSQIGQVAGVAGLAGLAGGAYAVFRGFKDSIDAAEQFGITAGQIATVTGQTNQQSQLLLATMQHFNVDTGSAVKVLGMLAKNMMAHGKTMQDAKKFQDQYGLSITDSTGHLLDQQSMLQRLGDYMNDGSIPAIQKDAAMTALLGRQWQTLLPMLQAGSKGMGDAADEAQRLGLGQQDLVAIAQQNAAAQRDFNTTLEALKVTVGAQLLPELTKVTQGLTQWFASPQNRAMIHEWVANLMTFGENAVGFFKDEVLPTIQGLASTIMGFWNSLPAGLRDLLVKGFVADKTVKFLFGVSIESVAGDVFQGMARQVGASLMGGLLGRGSPANPMFTVQEGGVGGGGPLGMLGGGGMLTKLLGGGLIAGGLATQMGMFGGGKMGDVQSFAGPLATIAGAVMMGGPIWGAIVAVGEAVKTGFDFMNTRDQAQTSLQAQADGAAQQTATQALGNLANLNQVLGNQGIWESLVTNTFGAKQSSDALVNLSSAILSGGHLDANQTQQAIADLSAAQALAISRGWTDAANTIGQDLANLKIRVMIQSQVPGDPTWNGVGDTINHPAGTAPGPGSAPAANRDTKDTLTTKQINKILHNTPGYTGADVGSTSSSQFTPVNPKRFKIPSAPGGAGSSGGGGMTVQQRIDALLSSLPEKFNMSKSAMEQMAKLAGVSADRIGKAWTTLKEHMSEASNIVKQLPKDFNMTAEAAQALAHGTKVSADQIMQAFSQLNAGVNKAASGILSGFKAILAGLPDGFKMTAAALKNLEGITGKGAAAITKAWQTMQAHATEADKIVAKLPKGYQMTMEAAQAMARGTNLTSQDIMDAFNRIQSTLDSSGPPKDEPVYQVGPDGKIRFVGFRKFGGGASTTTGNNGQPVAPPAQPGSPSGPPAAPPPAQPGDRLKGLLSKAMPVYITIQPSPVYININGQQVAQALTQEQTARYSVYTSPEGPYPGTGG
jgi:hypothetical protein